MSSDPKRPDPVPVIDARPIELKESGRKPIDKAFAAESADEIRSVVQPGDYEKSENWDAEISKVFEDAALRLDEILPDAKPTAGADNPGHTHASSNQETIAVPAFAKHSGIAEKRSRIKILAIAVPVMLLTVVAALGYLFSVSNDRADNSATLVQQPPRSDAAPPGMVYVAGGSFTMGGDEQITDDGDFNSPPHEVVVRPFFMDVFEVTCEEYKKFIDASNYQPPNDWKGKDFPAGKSKFPVTNVNWDAANAYAKWAGKRLPTEAEWEFAAKGTDNRRYSWGDVWSDGMANANNVNQGMVEVGRYKGASPFGIYDMIGNAWEWTSTTLEPYPNGNVPNVKNKAVERKIIRGGSWESEKGDAITTRRGFYETREATTYKNTSFRCVLDVPVK